ncbi:hypothetical protein HOD83_00460 [Candidatus Woesearchaeota archaeon]|nr:hypothetical protein [Candidatus Woesearchaeota archaeon]
MLHDKVANWNLTPPQSYKGEIEDFNAEGAFMIANREDDVGKLLEELAYSTTSNFVLLGTPGIGKSMAVDYIMDLITGKKTPAKESWVKHVAQIRKKAARFQQRDYMFLPNLEDAFSPVVIDFVNGEMDDRYAAAKDFSEQIINFFEQTPYDDKIFPKFTKAEFANYALASANDIQQRLYQTLNKIIVEPAVFHISPKKNLRGTVLKEEFLDKVSYTQLKNAYTGYAEVNTKQRRKLDTHEKVRTKLRAVLKKEISPALKKLYSDVDYIHVDDVSKEEKRQILLESFRTVNAQYKDISDVYLQEGAFAFSRELLRASKHKKPKLQISAESIDYCLESLENIVRGFDGKVEDRVYHWMKTSAVAFRTGRKHLAENLLEYYRDVSAGNIIFIPPPANRTSSKPTWRHKNISWYLPKFEMDHGKTSYSISQIFSPKKYTQSSRLGKLSIKYPETITKESLLGKIMTDSDEDSLPPPHRRYEPGYLMDSSILVMPDNMKAFFEAILTAEKQTSDAKRQTLLTFFQSGRLLVQEEGLSFDMYSPTLVLGCDNRVPFRMVSAEKTNELVIDHAMQRRFVVQYWYDSMENTSESRKGTMLVIQQALEKFNTETSSEMILTPEAIDWLIRETSTPYSINLRYDKLAKERVAGLLMFGKSQSITAIGLDEIKKYISSKEPKNKFQDVDALFDAQIVTYPSKQVGAMNSVNAYEVKRGSGDVFPEIISLRSSEVLDDHGGFDLYDLRAHLVEGETTKGYEEAADFVKRQVDEPMHFKLRTSFHQMPDYKKGDADSLAMAISMMSAITGDEVYQNRFCTGNLSAHDGSIGSVKNVFDRALGVNRWHELMAEEDDKHFFMFPADSFRDLSEHILTSPHPVEDNVEMVPVMNFEQAYYLSTALEITAEDIEHLPERASEHYVKVKERLAKRVSELNYALVGRYSPLKAESQIEVA